MAEALKHFILNKYNVRLGDNSIKTIITQTGSLRQNDIAFVTMRGVDVDTNELKTINITASDVREAVGKYYQIIAESIKNVISKCPPEVGAKLSSEGIVFVGGGASMQGMQKMMEDELGLPIRIPNAPHLITAIGGGKLIDKKDLLLDIMAMRG